MSALTGVPYIPDAKTPSTYHMSDLSEFDQDSFVPKPLTRSRRSESWFPRLSALPRLTATRSQSSQPLPSSDSDEQLELFGKAIAKFRFALTGRGRNDSIHLQEWEWYCRYLEYRAASAWALCATVLVDVSLHTATDDTQARCALYASFAVVAECLYGDAEIAFSPIIEKLQANKLVRDQACNDDLIAFTFQAVGWICALWDPLPASESPHLSFRSPQLQSRRQKKITRRRPRLTVSEAGRQSVRRIANKFSGPIPVPAFTPEEYSFGRDIESASITTAYLSYHSLLELVKVKLVWTSILSEHLNFDSRTKSLHIFKHPSICLLLIRAEGDAILSPMFEAERKEKTASEHHFCSNLVGYEDYLLEVLLSYQLIFGLHERSRKSISSTLSSTSPFSEQGSTVDPLLKLLCTAAPKSTEVLKLYQELELEVCENEVCISDVPFLAKKLLYLESVSKRHAPRTLRRLWKDRRNPTAWFALWAVLIIGAGTLILQFLQLIFQIYQVPM